MKNKVYALSCGWATKYLWLEPIWEVQVGENSEQLVKSGKENIFRPISGTSSGDILGSSLALEFFSENLVKLISNHGVKIRKYPIKIVLSEKSKKKVKLPIPDYFYIESTSFIESVYDGSWLSHEEREKATKKLDTWVTKKFSIVHTQQKDLRLAGLQRTFFNLSNWDGSDLFSVKNSRWIIVTERLKNIIEKAKLKNIEFEELKFLGDNKI
jgi:esterase/lipase